MRRLTPSRIAGIAARALLAAIVVVVLAPPAREALLRAGLHRAAGAVPGGRLEAEAVRWPRLGRVELVGMQWLAGADTLASAERIVLAVRLPALFHRDVVVERLEADRLVVDLPAVRARMPARTPARESRERGGVGPPSLAVEAFRLDARVVTQEGAPPARVALAGSLELRQGRVPALRLDSIEIRDDARSIALGPGSLRIDPAAGVGSGEVAGRWGEDFAFTLRARGDEPDRLTVELAVDEPDSVSGLRAEVALQREDGELRAIGLDAELSLPRAEVLAGLPGADALRRLPPGDRLEARVAGTWDPVAGAGTFAVACGPFAGWDSLRADVEAGPGRWAVTGIRLDAPGLAAEGDWRSDDGRVRGDLRAVVDGSDWMAALVPAGSRPDSLRATVEVEAEGPPGGLRGTVRAEGGAARGDTRVDSVRVRLDGALTGTGETTFDVTARASRVWVAASGAVTGRDPLRVELAPVRVTAARDSARGARSGRVVVDPAGGVSAEQVRVEGDFGEARVDGGLGTAGSWSGTARFRVPLPADSGAAAERAPVEGVVRAEGRGGEITARLEAAAAGWLEEARATVRAGAAGKTLDTLTVRALGATVTGSASVAANDSLVGLLRVDLAGLDGLRAFAPGIPESVSAEAAGDVSLSGTLASPGIAARFGVSARGPGWDVPGALAEIDLRGGAIAGARFHATDTVRAGGLAVHRLVAQARPLEDGALLPLFVSLEAEADSAGALVVAELDAGDSTVARVDTLAVRWGDRDLRSVHPFGARWDARGAAWSVRALELRGSLGHVLADGSAGPESVTFRAEIAMIDPPRPPWVAETSWPYPARVEAAGRLVSSDSLVARAAVRGMKVGTLGELDLLAEAKAGSGGIVSDVALEQDGASPLAAQVRIPLRIDARERTASAAEGRWSARVDVTDLPVPVRPSELAGARGLPAAEVATTARVSGVLDVVEKDGRLSGSADLDVTFPEVSSLRDDRVRLAASLAAAPGDSGAGLTAEITWLRAGATTARVDASLPGAAASAEPFSFAPGDDLRARAELDAWRLDDLDTFLPPGTRLEGTLSSRLTAEGSVRDPTLSGWFEARDIVVSTARGDEAHAHGRLDFAGSARSPEVDGKLEVTRARLLVPERKRALHDAAGDALLWPADSAAAAPEAPRRPTPVETLDVGVDLTIPGACWIHGRGLEVELAGNLSLVLSGGQPRVDGQLRAVRGTFAFLGTSFEVEHGTATFYGTEAIDPDLDLVLSRRKGDVKAIVRVTGRTAAPAIALSSEPPMEEADVVSYLLFGRASTDLDREQTGLLQSQAAAALQLYAMPGLQRELGSRLGLDVVQVRQRDDASERMSVVVGKYLSPRALLKYDQGLDSTEDFTVDLEYWLTRHLRVETMTSRQNQSGVLLNWSTDY